MFKSLIRYGFLLLLITTDCIVYKGFCQLPVFTEVSKSIGIDFEHDYQIEIEPVHYRVTAGMAVADYNQDGFPDIYVETGDFGNNLLYKNNGDGTFSENGVFAGVDLPNFLGTSPFFVDYDNDGYPDLMIGSLEGESVRIFKNQGGIRFEEVTGNTVLYCSSPTYSFSAGDFDKDGYLDLFLTHWNETYEENHIWKNQQDGTFRNVDEELGLYNPHVGKDFTFAGNFTDFNNDSWSDLLITSDFGTSQIWINKNGQQFEHVANPLVIDDENGMGSAIGDYNNDGLLDWFVSSVFDSDGVTEGNWGASGNRLYKNLGNNEFENVTEEARIKNGSWGWGSSFADLNNDGFLDIVQTNGWPKGSDQFYHDSTRIFISNQNGEFIETAIFLGMEDTRQGRGLSVLDYDLDGDLDIFINNYRDAPSFWRNDLNSDAHFLNVMLKPLEGLSAVGSKVLIYTKDQKQIRELRCGTNYNGQNPLNLHFGLSDNPIIDSLIVNWPNGQIQKHYQIPTNQFLEIDQEIKTLPVFEPISVFPNPFDDQLNVQFEVDSDLGKIFKLRLMDSNGRLVAEHKTYSLFNNSIIFDWDLKNNSSNLLPGFYVIQLCENDQVKICKKIVKN